MNIEQRIQRIERMLGIAPTQPFEPFMPQVLCACTACGIDFEGLTGYACPCSDCPTQPKATS